MPDLSNRRRPYHYVTALNLLMRLDVDLHAVSILSQGSHQNYRGEILAQTPAPGQPLTPGTPIELEVGYDSAVDYMPYQFFYGLAGITSRSDNWDLEARHLMAPFDGSVVRYNALTTGASLKFSLSQNDRDHLTRLLGLFGFVLPGQQPDLKELRLWSSLMPTFHHWAGNAECVSRVLAAIFEHRFSIVENVPSTTSIPAPLQSRLGRKSSALGVSTVLGNSFRECDSAYEVHVHGVLAREAGDWLPGKPLRRKLDWILKTVMPNNLDYRLLVHVDSRGFRLGAHSEHGRLGYTAHV
jgi:hypothetical protein